MTFDLTGLPPTPEEIEQFLKRQVPGRLRQGGRPAARLARGTASDGAATGSMSRATPTRPGMDEDNLYPHAWRYRDYVIDAFNEDKPYDRVRQASRSPATCCPRRTAAERARNVVATGFLALGPQASGAAGSRCR